MNRTYQRFLVVLLSFININVYAENLAIGFAHADLNNPYYIAMEKMAYTQASARGVNMIVLNASNNQITQNKQIETLLDKGIMGLIVNSVNEYGSMAAIKKAKSRGIPVVAIDRPLYGDYLAYVGIDQWRAGELQGEYIVKHLLPRGGNIVMLLGIPGEPATIGRENGMLNIIQHPKFAGKFSILGSYRADYSMDLGYQKMNEAIATFGGKIDLVYGLNDSMALGALKALREAGLTKVMVIGIDGQKEAYAEIAKGGQYKATVINNPGDITAKAVDLLVDHILSGKPPASKSVITGTVLVNKENASKYFNVKALF
jgi:ABC-type sugar transport system substrate-binding protein